MYLLQRMRSRMKFRGVERSWLDERGSALSWELRVLPSPASSLNAWIPTLTNCVEVLQFLGAVFVTSCNYRPRGRKVVQSCFTLLLGGSARFGPGRVTRWIQCSALPSLRSTLPRDVRFTTCGTALLALHSAEIACSLQWGYRMD
ncbi:hypothetical protein RB4343 [Rhodopirellula baltica SH 1]|uniref:Uncharacterized protein n=1 Tax=Rhodopirellula baltica (strain DSM 10527 / NCIMB 13988 / SH1) TaxID=243090 RepID=Q7USR9_RHOBA|nr:hypothetical protein RB4343 [Rhodopirellula baltica SH 1]